MVVSKKNRSSSLIRLSHTDDRVVVEPEDEDRFVITAQSAVKACKDQQEKETAIRMFKEKFLRPLISWCEARTERVVACYIPPPISYLQVFMVGASEKYDFELGQELSKLELELAESGWRVNVLQLPTTATEDLSTFFNTEGAIEVYAELEAAQEEGRT